MTETTTTTTELAESLAKTIIAAKSAAKPHAASERATVTAIAQWIESTFPKLKVCTWVDVSDGHKALADVLVNDKVALLVMTGGIRERWKQVDRDLLVISATRPDLAAFFITYDPALPNAIKDRVIRSNKSTESKSTQPWTSPRDPESLEPIIAALEELTK